MSIKQTYDNYHRFYYLKNRKKILARTKEYRRKYARDYYYKKKAAQIGDEKAHQRAVQAAIDAQAPGGTQVLLNTATPSEGPENPSTDRSKPFDDPLPSPDVYIT